MPTWDELYKDGDFRWSDPSDEVIELVPLLKERNAHRILDLACGAGRHLVYLSKAGFELYGTDIAKSGLDYAQQLLAQEQLAARLIQSEMAAIPFRAASFDAVICIHAIQHQIFQDLTRSTREIYRVLRPGGLFLSTFPSRRDRRYGQGEEIEPNTFLSTVGPDIGVPHHYCSLAEIEELLDGFAIKHVELDERLAADGNRYSHWQVLAARE